MSAQVFDLIAERVKRQNVVQNRPKITPDQIGGFIKSLEEAKYEQAAQRTKEYGRDWFV